MDPHQRWTQTTITGLRSRLAKGETIKQISETLGRNAESVEAMMLRLRLRMKAG